jgi:hypothetical protein
MAPLLLSNWRCFLSFTYCALAFFLLFFVLEAQGKVIKETTHVGLDGLDFITKFCITGKGSLQFHPKKIEGDWSDLKLLIFDDTVWDLAWDFRHKLTCEEIRKLAVPPTADAKQITNSTSISEKITDNVRPRWWYVAFSDCHRKTTNLRIEYELIFKNPGNYWYSQFSFDKQGLLVLYLLFWLLYALLAFGSVSTLCLKWRNGSLNAVLKFYTLVLLAELVGFFSLYLHEAVYGNDGIGAPGIQGFGEIMQILATLGFMGILLVFAKGYTLTTYTLKGKKLLIVLFSIFLLSYVAFFVWENVERNDISTQNSYESVPGIINLVLRFLLWCYFLFCVAVSIRTPYFKTTMNTTTTTTATASAAVSYTFVSSADADHGHEHSSTEGGGVDGTSTPSATSSSSSTDAHSLERAKKIFFWIFGGLGTLYFLLLPFTVCLSEDWTDYYRYKVIVAVDVAVTWAFQFMILMWLIPERDGLEFVDGGGIWWSPPGSDSGSSDSTTSGSSSAAQNKRYSFSSLTSSLRSGPTYASTSSSCLSASGGSGAAAIPLQDMAGKRKENYVLEEESVYDTL